MTNIIVSLIILLIIVLSISKIVIEKRKGVACVGCSQSSKCHSAKSGKGAPSNNQKIEIKQVA
ncbi:MAG: hypothetical protein ACI86X_001914 [Moritella sp.]|jgi:hypothetical protein